MLKLPQLGVFGEHIKRPYHRNDQAAMPLSPATFENKHSTKPTQRSANELEPSHRSMVLCLPMLSTQTGIGIHFAEMMGDIPVAHMANFDIEPNHRPPQLDLFMKALVNPFTPLAIV
jgi:hypothetical protein